MLDQVNLNQPDIDKDTYKETHDALIERLVTLQQQARFQGVGLVVLFEGWNGAGKGSRISDLMFNLDARATSVHVTGDFDVDEARAFSDAGHNVTGYWPFMQQFWQALGPRGAITFYDRGWYSVAAERAMCRAFGGLNPKRKEGKKGASRGDQLAARKEAGVCLASIREFERGLVDDGYEVVKFFIHVSAEGQRERLERLAADPTTAWRVDKKRLERIGNYEYAYSIYDLMLEGSNFAFAPWTLVNGEDKRRANIVIAQTLVRALESALARKGAANSVKVASAVDSANAVDASTPADASASADGAAKQPPRFAAPATSRFHLVDDPPTLEGIDHSLALSPEEYKDELKSLQKRLFRLENNMYQARIPLMVMYEGWDAAGKGGNIKRVAQSLDARAYTIFPSPAPTAPELAHPHLWRYWTRLPKAGHVGIYDRSWYGRVLVERVEGYASPERLTQAYDEINAFEKDLVDWGAILLKFWVEVSPGEQLRRFKERQSNPAKQWKITDDDWRNREKYPQYKEAIEDMFRLTSNSFAPWIILESDDKRYARVKALRTIVAALEDAGLSD